MPRPARTGFAARAVPPPPGHAAASNSRVKSNGKHPVKPAARASGAPPRKAATREATPAAVEREVESRETAPPPAQPGPSPARAERSVPPPAPPGRRQSVRPGPPPGIAIQVPPPAPAPDFKVGDKAVHPAHGVGEVTAIEEREIGGTRARFYILRIQDNG